MSIQGVSNNNQIYETSATGDIKIATIQNDSILKFAEECDADTNGLLENTEIVNFYEKLKYSNEILENLKSIKEDEKLITYQEKFDHAGRLKSKAAVSKRNNSQFYFHYRNGELTDFVMSESSGKVHHFMLNDKTSIVRDSDDSKDGKLYKVTTRNIEKIKAFSEGKYEEVYKSVDFFEKIYDCIELLF